MEKYYVTKVENHQQFCQIVTIKNKSGQTEVVTVGHSIPEIPLGTKFKVYKTRHKEPFSLSLAHSYKIKGKRFINLAQQPTSIYGIKHAFWNKLKGFDCIQLNHDIKQVLRQRDIKPSLNKNTNLILLLNQTIHR